MPAVAVHAVPLVQVTVIPPVASTFEPLIGLMLPNAIALVDRVQLAVTVASTLSVELVVAAKAGWASMKGAAMSSAPARWPATLRSSISGPHFDEPAALRAFPAA